MIDKQKAIISYQLPIINKKAGPIPKPINIGPELVQTFMTFPRKQKST